MKLTRDFLRQPWLDGRIQGFISKDRVEELLAHTSPGTFLLRFSDSQMGEYNQLMRFL